MERAVPDSEENILHFVSIDQCDITYGDQVEQVIQKIRPEVAIDTAPPRGIGLRKLDFYMSINCDGTANVLDACAGVGNVKAFVYTSSSSVVHDTFSDLTFVSESAPLLFLSQ